TEVCVGIVVIRDLRIPAVQRGPPTRVPEVLVGCVDVPSSSQLDVVCSCGTKCATIYTISHDAKTYCRSIDETPIGIRGLEDVAQRTLGVVDLHLEVIALANHWRVHLHATADCPTQLIIRMTA